MRRDRQAGRTARTAESRPGHRRCATSSRARRSTSSRRCARLPNASYDLIIGVGFAQAPIMETVAKDYPNIHFAIVDGVSELPNVASLVFKEHEGSYLVGMLAAKTSKTGHARLSRRHGHRPDSPLRQGLRRRRAIGESEHPRHPELRRRHRRRLEQSRARARSSRWRRSARAPT